MFEFIRHICDQGEGRAEFLERQCIRTLCYPDGARAVADGGHGGELGVVPGAHLFRVPYHASGSQSTDEGMDRWLEGKIHPLTQEPLRIKRLDVPPGSFISFCHHMPHWVGARAPGAPTRWAALFAYRTPDPELHNGGQKWGTAAPKQWLRRVEAAVARGDYPPLAPSALSILGRD